jgi:NAD(P)H dehydrogenase (quinone)
VRAGGTGQQGLQRLHGELDGGQESTPLALYHSVHHFGGILVAPGYIDPVKFAEDNPY